MWESTSCANATHTWGEPGGEAASAFVRGRKSWGNFGEPDLVITTGSRYNVPLWFASPVSQCESDHGAWTAGDAPEHTRRGQLGRLRCICRHAMPPRKSPRASRPSGAPRDALSSARLSPRVILASAMDGPWPPARLAGQSAAAPPRPGPGYRCTSRHEGVPLDLEVPSYLQMWRLVRSAVAPGPAETG